MNYSKLEYKQCSLKEIQEVIYQILVDVAKVCDENNINYWLSDGTLLGAIRHKGFIPWDDDIDIQMTYEDLCKFIDIAQTELGDKYFIQTIHTDSKYSDLVTYLKVRDNNSVFIENEESECHQGAFIDIFPMNRYRKYDFIFKLKKMFFRILNVSKGNYCNLKGLKKIISHVLYHIFRFIPDRKLIAFETKQDSLHNQNGSYLTYSFTCPTKLKIRFKYNDIFPLQKAMFCGNMFSVPNNYDAILKMLYSDYMKLPPKSDRISHAKFYGIKPIVERYNHDR